jgi:hypothetical protein
MRTKVPWGVSKTICIGRPNDEKRTTIVSLENKPVAECFQRDIEAAEDNAAYIVRAVNAHEDLVRALSIVFDYADRCESRGVPFPAQVSLAVQEALAKAGWK